MDTGKALDRLTKKEDTIAMESAVSETPKKAVQELVPEKEQLITMTPDELEELKKRIIEETARQIMESPDHIERLRISMEKASALRDVENRKEYADPALVIMQSGPLGPIDHQEAVAAPFKTDPSMAYRFINHMDDTIRAVRAAQGWEPVLDEKGNVVRHMDGTLAKMPKRKKKDTLDARVEANKRLRKQSVHLEAQRFKEAAARQGVQTTGNGLQFDKTVGE